MAVAIEGRRQRGAVVPWSSRLSHLMSVGIEGRRQRGSSAVGLPSPGSSLMVISTKLPIVKDLIEIILPVGGGGGEGGGGGGGGGGGLYRHTNVRIVSVHSYSTIL